MALRRLCWRTDPAQGPRVQKVCHDSARALEVIGKSNKTRFGWFRAAFDWGRLRHNRATREKGYTSCRVTTKCDLRWQNRLGSSNTIRKVGYETTLPPNFGSVNGPCKNRKKQNDSTSKNGKLRALESVVLFVFFVPEIKNANFLSHCQRLRTKFASSHVRTLSAAPLTATGAFEALQTRGLHKFA